jgi:Uma2 family endonuclease
MATQARATVDDVLRLGAQGERYELVDGELVAMSPTGLEHAIIEAYAAWVFNGHVLPRRLGQVAAGEALFRLDPAAGIARAPDLAFIRQDRLQGQSLAGAFVGAPDLAVEIVSPSDSAKDVQRKVEDWLAHGTPVVLLMYPETRSVVLWRNGQATALHDADVVDLDDVLPGFRRPARDLFPPPLDNAPRPSEESGDPDPQGR